MRESTSKQTEQLRMKRWSGRREQIAQFLRGKNLVGKEGQMSYEDQKLTWNNGVRKAIRRGAAENEVKKQRDYIVGALRQVSRQRPKTDVSYDRSMINVIETSKCMDECSLERASARKRKEEGGIRRPLHSTWVADFMMRQDAVRCLLGKYLSDKQVPWKRRKRI